MQLRKKLHGIQGVIVEKKRFSVTVHYRASHQRSSVRHLVLAAVAALSPGPRVLAGKCVVNLLVPELPNKGQALQSLKRTLKLRSAVYAGDDVNDEDVFALPDPRICSIRVGRHKGSRAKLYLRRQSEINRLLRLLVNLRAPKKSR